MKLNVENIFVVSLIEEGQRKSSAPDRWQNWQRPQATERVRDSRG